MLIEKLPSISKTVDHARSLPLVVLLINRNSYEKFVCQSVILPISSSHRTSHYSAQRIHKLSFHTMLRGHFCLLALVAAENGLSSIVTFTQSALPSSFLQTSLPGNVLAREDSAIVKEFGKTKKSRRNAKYHYMSEKRALIRLAQHTDVCAAPGESRYDRKHFPALLSHNDRTLKLGLSYQGQVVVNQNQKQFKHCNLSKH